MAKKIKLELTNNEFDALIALAEEMAITLGTTGDETSAITLKRVNIVNKALKKNNIDYIINT